MFNGSSVPDTLNSERADALALAGQTKTENRLTLDPATVVKLICKAVREDTSNTTYSFEEKGIKR